MVCGVFCIYPDMGVRCGMFCIYPDMGVRCGEVWYVLYIS